MYNTEFQTMDKKHICITKTISVVKLRIFRVTREYKIRNQYVRDDLSVISIVNKMKNNRPR